MLLEDPTLYVDDAGMLLYIDENTTDGELIGENAVEPEVAAAAAFPYSQTFQLHSRPGSSRVIYLDFDGHVTSGTAWNTNYTGGAPINSAPYSIDGDPYSFNQQEMDAIQYIWQRVAEDFAAFDVDVTTQDPGDAAIFRSNSFDSFYGTRAVISPTNFVGQGIGGIAYVGVFNYVGTNYKPAFVMTSGVGNGEKSIAEAASHEVGHNLGLSHDGAPGTGYYEGHGDWAPIMGVGYYRAVTQWSSGEYPGANQRQDDLAVMQNYGIAIVPDDHGDSSGSATVLTGTSVSASGIITTRSDTDVFRFSTGSGSVSFNIVPAPRGPNLNIKATISDSFGNVLTTVDPAGLPASWTATLSSGVYYLTIDGVGAGDLATGYSDYGSIGQYSLTGTLGTSASQPPTAVVSANPTSGTTPLTVTFSSNGSSDPDGTISGFSWNFGDGTSSTDPNPVHVYNSAGTFSAVLTVTDNSGLTATKSVTINATATQNQSPVAVAGANVTSGSAPLTVNFSSQGSYDPDGTIASYAWSFGNGATSNQVNPSYTYTTAGNYTATLTVTDNKGATATSSVTINVGQGSSAQMIYVNSIQMSLLPAGWFSSSAMAVITVYGSNGQPRPGVAVSAQWSGLAGDSESGVTDSSGRVTFTSNSSLGFFGTFTITVNNLSASGYTYDPSRNVVTSASINR
ncbi:MAG: PKD domain-containing protein [Acidobacteria bacterium]|nr:PKD domain-containing protein [Acidobacteriota bacterium]